MKEFINTTKDKGKFKAFIPFGTFEEMIIEKGTGKKKRKFLQGIASNTQVDKEGERVTKNFIAKMKQQAVGLTVFAEHEHTIDKTLGYVEEIGGDEDNFEVVTSLEPEYDPEENPTGNETVTKVLNKLKHGTSLGYSIGGRVTKAVKVYDEELKKDVIELDDGELYEVTVTAMPAGKNTFVQPILKSMNEFIDEVKPEEEDVEKSEDKIEIEHSSLTSDDEPLWSGVSKSKLPDQAYASRSEFPHHWVENGNLGDNETYVDGKLFLHKAGLITAWGMIKNSEKVDKKVKKHLSNHIKEIGITTKQADNLSEIFGNQKASESEVRILIKSYSIVNKFVNGDDLTQPQLSKALDEMVEMDNIHEQIYDLFWAFKSSIYQIINNSELEPINKKEKINMLAGEFGDRIENLSSTLATLAQAIDEQIG